MFKSQSNEGYYAERNTLFDPYNISDLAKKIEQYLINHDLRQINAMKTYSLSKKYSWDKCKNETFPCLLKI